MTHIEWADEVWSPVTGCTKISPGCKHCYAERMAKRLRGRFGYPKDEPFQVTLHPERLIGPKKWKKPRMVFVCSMGDLFHEDVPFDFIHQVFNVMADCRGIGHTFLVLTKRPKRMLRFFKSEDRLYIPPKNVWLGVTAENQEQADKRIPILLQIPAKVRFVSVEPMLGPIDLLTDKYHWLEFDGIYPGLDWVICGGESGPVARPMNPDQARELRDQCKAAGVPFFMKQIDKRTPIPDDLMIREFPNV